MEDAVTILYVRARKLVAYLEDHSYKVQDQSNLNGILAGLIENGQHPFAIAEQLGLKEKEVRDRVTLYEPGMVHSDASDFRYTANHIEDTLRGQITPTNFAAAPLLRLVALLKKMADGYEASQQTQASRLQQSLLEEH